MHLRHSAGSCASLLVLFGAVTAFAQAPAAAPPMPAAATPSAAYPSAAAPVPAAQYPEITTPAPAGQYPSAGAPAPAAGPTTPPPAAPAYVAAAPPPRAAMAPMERAPESSPDAPLSRAFLLQARMQTQVGVLSLGATSPGFLVGYQGHNVAFGLGVGYLSAGISEDNGSSTSATIFQVTPTLLVDVWHSQDRRTRANLVGSIGVGSASVTTSSQSCSFSTSGVSTCTNVDRTSRATLIPLQLGFGGDHFLSSHFGLGAEVGAQFMFFTGLEEAGQSSNASADMRAFYGLLRMTMLFGSR